MPSPPWDQARADSALAALLDVIDRADGEPGRTPSQKNLLQILREQAQDHHARHESALFEMADGWLEKLFGEWRERATPKLRGSWDKTATTTK